MENPFHVNYLFAAYLAIYGILLVYDILLDQRIETRKRERK